MQLKFSTNEGIKGQGTAHFVLSGVMIVDVVFGITFFVEVCQ